MVQVDITDCGTNFVRLELEDGTHVLVTYDGDADCMRVTGDNPCLQPHTSPHPPMQGSVFLTETWEARHGQRVDG